MRWWDFIVSGSLAPLIPHLALDLVIVFIKTELCFEPRLVNGVTEVNHNSLLHHIPDALDKRLMNRIRCHIVVSVLRRRKLSNKPMCQSVLLVVSH